MRYAGVPSEYHVAGSFQRFVDHAYPFLALDRFPVRDRGTGLPLFVADRCIGACDHEYERYRKAPDGALWDAGGSPIGRTL